MSKLISKKIFLSDVAIIGAVALASFILHLLAIKGYGIFRDELYYIACSDHLALGYVDQPPLSLFLLKGIRLLLGDSLISIRILPVIGGSVFILLTGFMAKALGGNKFAILLACTAAFASIGNFFAFNYYSMNFLDLLFWQACILVLIQLTKTQNPKYWILFGIIAGLGLLNKISVLFLGLGIIIGLVLTKERKQLLKKEFWIGAAIALLFFSPYVIWNIMNHWPHLEFIHNAKAYKMSHVTPVIFFIGQLLHNNPANVLIWFLGLVFFFFHKTGRQYRLFGWMFVSLYVLFTIQEAKDYYLSPAYPVLFTGGSVLLADWLHPKKWRWVKPILIFSLVVSTLVFCPFSLPILSVDSYIIFSHMIGIQGGAGENHEIGSLPQHYADMHGWEKMVQTVAEVYDSLTHDEQSNCLIYVRNYGQAGAIDYFGKQYGLPKATCAHNNYWYWGPPEWDGNVAIIFGISQDVQTSLENLQAYFEDVQHAATFSCTYCMPYENNRPIFICRGAKFSIQEIWNEEKHFI